MSKIFYKPTTEDTNKLTDKLTNLINEIPTSHSVSKVKGLLKELLADDLEIFLKVDDANNQ